MKKFFKIIFILLLIIFPNKVLAASVSVSPSSLSITTGSSKSFSIVCTGCEGAVTVSSSNSNVASVVSVSNNGWIDSNGVTVNIKGVNAGSATITINLVDVSDTAYNSITGTRTVSVNVTNPVIPTPTPTPPANLSSNNNLNSLSVSGCNLSPTFSSSITSYSCAEVDRDSVSISASKADSSASISGIGTRTLNYGNNTLYVVVTAANGNRKTYSIKIPRKDTRNSDNTLSSLTIEGQSIKFDKNKTEYSLTVSANVEYLMINAVPTDSKATVSGTGKVNLKTGKNVIEIVVKAENETTKKYIINCIQSEKENIPSTTLTSLKYNNKEIDLSSGFKTYLIGLDKYSESIKLEYKTSSKTTKYLVKGDNLKEGINKVTIEVSDTNCKKVIYTLYVYVPDKSETIVKSLNGIKDLNSNIIYNSNQYKNQIITSDIIKLINKNNKSLTYNMINEYNGLLYSFVIDKNSKLLSKNLELKFIKISDEPLKFSSNIPKNIEITAYIDNSYSDGTKLKLYTYDQKNNKYILIKDNIEVKDGYVKFVSDGSSEYIFSTEKLKVKTTIFEWIIRIICILIGASIPCLVYFIKNNKEKNKKTDEIISIEELEKQYQTLENNNNL